MTGSVASTRTLPSGAATTDGPPIAASPSGRGRLIDTTYDAVVIASAQIIACQRG